MLASLRRLVCGMANIAPGFCRLHGYGLHKTALLTALLAALLAALFPSMFDTAQSSVQRRAILPNVKLRASDYA
jgi:hypothetical protein